MAQPFQRRVMRGHPHTLLSVLPTFALAFAGRGFSDASFLRARKGGGASLGGWAHQKGERFQRLHRPHFFARPDRLGNRLDVEFCLSEAPRMDQREFAFLARVGAPSAVPEQWVRMCKTYRQAVKLAWERRTNEALGKQDLASTAGLTAQHVSDYLAKDDKPSRRSLPASKVADYERVVGNTLVSQWLASQSKLTVLEEMQATRAVA